MLNDYYGYLNPKAIPLSMFKGGAPLGIPDNSPYSFGAGIEIEVEGCFFQGALAELHAYKPWAVIKDGSLRNHGYEFVSPYLRHYEVIPALNRLLKYLKESEPKHSFSDRTSVHVHLDCRFFKLEHLTKLLLVYPTVETLLFLYAGKNRFDSKFCVPSVVGIGDNIISRLLETTEPQFPGSVVEEDLKMLFGNHYAALNVDNMLVNKRGGGPTGTLEFRHMVGNCDPEFISTWISMLDWMRHFAITTPFEKIRDMINKLNVSSNYREYLDEVFGPYAKDIIRGQPLHVIFGHISKNITITKSWLAQPTPKVSGVAFLETDLAKRIQGVVFDEGRREPPRPNKPDFRLNIADLNRNAGPQIDFQPFIDNEDVER